MTDQPEKKSEETPRRRALIVILKNHEESTYHPAVYMEVHGRSANKENRTLTLFLGKVRVEGFYEFPTAVKCIAKDGLKKYLEGLGFTEVCINVTNHILHHDTKPPKVRVFRPAAFDNLFRSQEESDTQQDKGIAASLKDLLSKSSILQAQ